VFEGRKLVTSLSWGNVGGGGWESHQPQRHRAARFNELSILLEEKREITQMGISMRHCYHDLL